MDNSKDFASSSSQAQTAYSTPTTQYPIDVETEQILTLICCSRRLSDTPGNLKLPTPTLPATLEYKDPNLTGCYAGTGEFTTLALDPVQRPQASFVSMLSAAGCGPANNPPQTYSMDGIQLTGGPSTLAVGSKTLTPGSPPLFTTGHTLSLAAKGTLIADNRTSMLSAAGFGSNSQHQTSTIGGIQSVPQGQYALGTQFISGVKDGRAHTKT